MKSRLAVLLCMSLACSVGITAMPAHADAQAVSTADVDKVLSALAAVVKDRAKQVAARTLADTLGQALCDNGLSIKVKEIQLVIGSQKTNSDSGGWDSKDSSDTIFADTCRMLTSGQYGLTDPHFLKTLSRDTVRMVVRVAASDLSAMQYRTIGLDSFADFIHAAMIASAKAESGLGSMKIAVSELKQSLIAAGHHSKVIKDILHEFRKGQGTSEDGAFLPQLVDKVSKSAYRDKFPQDIKDFL